MTRHAHRAMGTVFTVVLAGGGREAAAAAFAEADRLEAELSRFASTSEVARINALRPGERVRLSPDAFRCVREAEWIRRLTRGAFDPAYAAKRSRYSLVPRGRWLVNLGGRIALDLGAIGKGYALDRMRVLLAEWEAGPALLSAGESTVLATAPPPGKPAWTLRLRHPVKTGATAGMIRLARGAVSGSGVALRGRHIRGAVRPGAWAAARSAAVSDALSTAFMVMTEVSIHRLVSRRPAWAAVLAAGGRGRVQFTRAGSARFVTFDLEGEAQA